MAKIDAVVEARRKAVEALEAIRQPAFETKTPSYGRVVLGVTTSAGDLCGAAPMSRGDAERLRDWLCEWYGLPESAPAQTPPAPSGWRPASEPPSDGLHVFVMHTDGREVHVARFVASSGRFTCHCGADLRITHWHPLPEPPKP